MLARYPSGIPPGLSTRVISPPLPVLSKGMSFPREQEDPSHDHVPAPLRRLHSGGHTGACTAPGPLAGPGTLAAVLLGGLYLVPIRAMGPCLTENPGDLIDGRFNNYVLEHGWLVLTGRQPSFWDAPFFYPSPG